MPWHKEYINPQRLPLVTPIFDGFTLGLYAAPDSMAVPFLYAIIVEGDNQKWAFEATSLANNIYLSVMGWVLMQPDDERPFLTPSVLFGAQVSKSDVTRPWMFEVNGYAAAGAELILPVSGRGPDGSRWDKQFRGPCREPLPETLQPHFQIGLSMKASPDGVQTPSLNGIILEGDERRFYLSAAAFTEGLDMSGLRLLKYSDGNSSLMMQWIEPKFLGWPSITNRLQDLYEKGKLNPGVSYFDE